MIIYPIITNVCHWRDFGILHSLRSPPCLPLKPVQSSEHMAAFGVFGLCQIHAFVDYLRSKLNAQQFEVLFKSVISLVGFVLLSVGTVLMLTGKRLAKDPLSKIRSFKSSSNFWTKTNTAVFEFRSATQTDLGNVSTLLKNVGFYLQACLVVQSLFAVEPVITFLYQHNSSINLRFSRFKITFLGTYWYG